MTPRQSVIGWGRSILFFLVTACLPMLVQAQTNQYAAHGVVQQIAPDHRHVTIQHENIPGYMMAMTMDFPVHDTNLVTQLTPGAKIAFTLVVTPDDDWVENIQVLGQTNVPTVPTVPLVGAELEVGDALPPMEVTDENGHTLHLSDFHGRAVAFTFFFTRCPLPNFCPLMNKNFAAARQLLAAQTNAPANWQFLSISFDPDFDQPETLQRYASYYRGSDTNRWLFASASTNTLRQVAPLLDFHFWHANGTLSHNLRTVVLPPQGKISAQFDNNDWTPTDLAQALLTAARTN